MASNRLKRAGSWLELEEPKVAKLLGTIPVTLHVLTVQKN